jgi:hypothetical protein
LELPVFSAAANLETCVLRALSELPFITYPLLYFNSLDKLFLYYFAYIAPIEVHAFKTKR